MFKILPFFALLGLVTSASAQDFVDTADGKDFYVGCVIQQECGIVDVNPADLSELDYYSVSAMQTISDELGIQCTDPEHQTVIDDLVNNQNIVEDLVDSLSHLDETCLEDQL